MVTNRDLEMPSERSIRSLSPSAEHSSFFRRTARRRFFDKTLPAKLFLKKPKASLLDGTGYRRGKFDKQRQ
jgi:hypothetical protein